MSKARIIINGGCGVDENIKTSFKIYHEHLYLLSKNHMKFY